MSLGVDEHRSAIDFGLALSVARLFDITEKQASETLKDIKDVVDSHWRRLEKKFELSRGEIEDMAPAFNMAFKS